MGSWAIMGLNAALFGSCCFVVANVATQIGAEALEPATIELPAIETSAPPILSPRKRHAAILDRNLFGAQLAGDAQVANTVVDEPLVKTKLPLRLLGTAAATRVERSRAAIQDEKTKKHLVVAVGDRLEGHNRVRVDAIERARVILDNDGRPEELALLEDGAAMPKAKVRRRSAQARRRPRAGKTDKMKERLDKLSGGDDRALSSILSQARIVPHYVDGEMRGLKVDSIKADSLFQKVGLQNGDVIHEINGIVIDRTEASSAILEEFSTADQFEIAASRGGSAVQMSASAAEILEKP